MNEAQALFQRVIELIDCIPWDLRYQLESEGADFGGDKTRIYLVDTQTGWYAHAAVSVADFKDAAQDLERSGITHDEMTFIANGVIHGAKNETVTTEDAELYLSITALWLTRTATFQQLVANDALGSHVFAFSYTTQSGAMLLRPAMSINHAVNFYPIEQVLNFTREVISMDVGNASTHVGQSLTRAGGALLAPIFK